MRIAANDCTVACAAAGGSIMADREFTCPIPRPADVPSLALPAARNWERIALKWRAMAEQRRAHFRDLYRSGRWKHYYADAQFLAEMRQAVAVAERWAKIAPLPEEREPPIEIEQSKAA